MRMKALGVALMVAFAAFTTFYWITDAPRRGVFETETDATTCSPSGSRCSCSTTRTR